jgi:hypothetical protein
MIDSKHTRHNMKALGLWASIAGILIALMISYASVGSDSAPPAAVISSSYEVVSMHEVASIREVAAMHFMFLKAHAADESIEVNRIDVFDWLEISVPPKLHFTQRSRPLVFELPGKKKAGKIVLTARSKKAERLFQPIIIRAAHRHKVDPAMVQAIIMAESSFNPTAISKKGAVGLMQLMPSTAESLGVKDIFDPEHNINGGVLYFRKLLNRFKGNVELALAAYNAGSRKVREHQGVPPFTQTYIRKVFEYYDHYKNNLDQG